MRSSPTGRGTRSVAVVAWPARTNAGYSDEPSMPAEPVIRTRMSPRSSARRRSGQAPKLQEERLVSVGDGVPRISGPNALHRGGAETPPQLVVAEKLRQAPVETRDRVVRGVRQPGGADHLRVRGGPPRDHGVPARQLLQERPAGPPRPRRLGGDRPL